VFDPHYTYEPAEIGGGAVCESLEALPDLLAAPDARVIFRPEDEFEDLEAAAQLVFWCRDLLWIIDEAEEFYAIGKVPPQFRSAIARSRMNRNSIILIGHGPTELPVKFRRLAQFVVFRTLAPADLDFYRSLGVAADDVARMPTLGRGEFVTFPKEDLHAA
jgi:hypothetical protein